MLFFGQRTILYVCILFCLFLDLTSWCALPCAGIWGAPSAPPRPRPRPRRLLPPRPRPWSRPARRRSSAHPRRWTPIKKNAKKINCGFFLNYMRDIRDFMCFLQGTPSSPPGFCAALAIWPRPRQGWPRSETCKKVKKLTSLTLFFNCHWLASSSPCRSSRCRECCPACSSSLSCSTWKTPPRRNPLKKWQVKEICNYVLQVATYTFDCKYDLITLAFFLSKHAKELLLFFIFSFSKTFLLAAIAQTENFIYLKILGTPKLCWADKLKFEF